MLLISEHSVHLGLLFTRMERSTFSLVRIACTSLLIFLERNSKEVFRSFLSCSDICGSKFSMKSWFF
ncbi:hypothetical protein OESDEN_12414 [Oesophagostomum dentatum]|uniref:Uncharacterized protein n=1 Tax=Oesophagostomum dentatum TaxID=61180 RepID=A0A0B1SR62_OESDE|nr:hypothetical protein OESDEN_12414 [Oesophagostomum dentatum]